MHFLWRALLRVSLGAAVLEGSLSSGQSFAVFSPAAIAKMPATVDADTRARIVKDADRALQQEPHPMAHPHTEHVLPSGAGHADSVRAQQDWRLMLNLALAYRITGDRKYLAAAEKYTAALAAVWHSDLNPIDDTQTDQLMMMLDLTRGDLTPSTEKAVLATIHAMGEGYVRWMEQKGSTDNANWTSHRAKLALMAAYAAGDAALVARAERQLMAHQSLNINPDGSVVDFVKRDALHYVVFDLEPLEAAALAEQAHGKDSFHAGADGKTVAHGVEWLEPYALGQKQHMEFAHSTVPWDAERDRAGVKGYSGPWDRSTSVDDFAMAYVLDAKFVGPLRQISVATKTKPATWIMVYAETRVTPPVPVREKSSQ